MAPRAQRSPSRRFAGPFLAATLALQACAADDVPEAPDDVPETPGDASVDASKPYDASDDAPDVVATDALADALPPRDGAADVSVDRPVADATITCPMPAPAFIVEGGRCVPSCLAAGGNLCNAALCAGRDLLAAYDCPTCCATPPSNCGGLPSQWTCAPSTRARQRCVNGQIQTEDCAGACIPGNTATDAVCGTAPSVCTGSASGSSPVWTCTADHRSRQRCVSGATQTEACGNSCVENAVGADDVCATAPSGCAGSASGTSSIWTCAADLRSRQRCVSGATQTEACPSGCTTRPLGTDDVCASGSTGCAGSASGTTAIWTCTSDGRARQRCVSSSIQTEACMYGCTAMPTGVDDVCTAMPAPGGSGSPSCALPQWWNLPYSWSPGYYSVRYGVDSDLRMTAGTGVQLRHASRLLAEGVYGWGWMPEFQDTVTGHRFRFLHLQPSRRLTTSIGTTYPAGTLVGYSGGNTADTGYPTYSTGAHLCVQTQVAYRTAFPMGTDACR